MISLNLEQAMSVALEAAAVGAGILMSGYGSKPKVSFKGAIDLVTEFDLKAEEAIRRILAKAYPDHLLVGEEEGGSGFRQADYKWYIDPLDGTTNFAHGHPFFSVSIGLMGPGPDGRECPLVGVINAPALGELYWGYCGGGAVRRQQLHGRGFTERPLKVTETSNLREALLNTGFPYDIYERGGEVLHPFGRLVMAARAVRRAGAASLDIAYVAAGLADAFWESGLKPWDVAAGLLLLNEAGGRFSDYQGEDYIPGQSREILGSNAVLHDTLLDYLKA